jgi:hypothetical protein
VNPKIYPPHPGRTNLLKPGKTLTREKFKKISVIPITLFSLSLALLLSLNWITVSFAESAVDQIGLVHEMEIEELGPTHNTESIIDTSSAFFDEIAVIAGAPLMPELVSPADGASGVSASPNLEVFVSDPDGDDLTVTFYGRPASSTSNEDFTIIALPDTQHYTHIAANVANFSAQTQWIVDNRVPLNIGFVTQFGDIVQNGDNYGDDSEWLIADAAMGLLEDPVTTSLADGIAYGLAPGNHDQGDTGDGSTGQTLLFNQYFGVSRFQGRGYYGGSHAAGFNDNNYELFSINGYDFIIIHFEYDNNPPNTAVLDWADNLLKTYPNRRAIAVTHNMVYQGFNANHSGQGKAIYEALKDNPNLFLMMGGHNTGEGQRQDTFNGNTVYSFLANYASRSNGGNGWLRILEFSPANNEIRVKTYSPVLDQFETDADSQFTLPYDLQEAGFQVIATNSNVPSGSNTSTTWPGLNFNTEYEWYATVDDGSTNITGETWSLTTLIPANTPPTVDIEPDQQTITLPSDAYLDGTVTDDGFPLPPNLNTTWSVVNGPGSVTFANASAVDTTASFSTDGLYVLRLTADDGAESDYDEVTITVLPAINQPPTVSAGLPQTIDFPDFAILDGTVIDDGLPAPPNLDTQWSVVSGLGSVNFADVNAVDTTASFSKDGVYVLRLTANDGAKSAYDEVTITVLPVINQPPTVNAGVPQTIELPDCIYLDASVIDDGLPSPPNLSTTWSKISGPGSVNFAEPNAVDTTACFSSPGVYQLLLEANDGEFQVFDSINITVDAAPLKYVWLPVLISKP